MKPGERRRSWFTPALIGVAIATLAIRLIGLGTQDYWLDELHSLMDSAARLAEFESLPANQILREVPRFTELTDASTPSAVWRGMQAEAHAPLYFIGLNVWRRAVGDAEFMVRLPAALLSALSVLPVVLLLRELGRPWTGIIAGLILMLAHAHIQMGQQARPYSLALLFVGMCYWITARMTQRWSSSSLLQRLLLGISLAIASLAAMLTHYVCVLALLGLTFFVLCRTNNTPRLAWLVANVAAAIAFAVIWLPSLLTQTAYIAAQDWQADTEPGRFGLALLRWLDLPTRLLFLQSSLAPDNALALWLRPAIGAAFLAGALCYCRHGGRRETLLFVLWYAAPTIALLTIDLAWGKQLLAHLRYSSIALPGLAGLIALAVAQMGAKRAGIASVLLAALFGSTLSLPATDNPAARELVRQLEPHVGENDLIVFDALHWTPYWSRRDLALVSYYMRPMRCAALMLDDQPDDRLRAEMGQFERILVVTPRRGEIPTSPPATHRAVWRSAYIDGVGWLYRFERAEVPDTGGADGAGIRRHFAFAGVYTNPAAQRMIAP